MNVPPGSATRGEASFRWGVAHARAIQVQTSTVIFPPLQSLATYQGWRTNPGQCDVGPSCSATHVPGYIRHPNLQTAGQVFVVAVNDPFVYGIDSPGRLGSSID